MRHSTKSALDWLATCVDVPATPPSIDPCSIRGVAETAGNAKVAKSAKAGLHGDHPSQDDKHVNDSLEYRTSSRPLRPLRLRRHAGIDSPSHAAPASVASRRVADAARRGVGDADGRLHRP